MWQDNLPSRFSIEGVDSFEEVPSDSFSFKLAMSFFKIPTFGSLIVGNKDRMVGKSRDDAPKCSIASE